MTVVTPYEDLADAPVIEAGPDGPRLTGARCGACGVAWFPYRAACPACAAPAPGRFFLGQAGTLYSWSTVHVSSARPVPYTLGYVDLDEGVRVLATMRSAGELALGVRCRLRADGDQWWFSPSGELS